MAGKFRRIAVLGVTSLGTWAVVPVVPPADEKAKAATPVAHTVPLKPAPSPPER
jgi:hypothetical protein